MWQGSFLGEGSCRFFGSFKMVAQVLCLRRPFLLKGRGRVKPNDVSGPFSTLGSRRYVVRFVVNFEMQSSVFQCVVVDWCNVFQVGSVS